MYKKLFFLFLSLPIYASTVAITTISPHKQNIPFIISTDAIVMPRTKSIITVKTSGIVHLNVFENSSVKKGDIIATVVNPLRKKKLHYLQNKLDLERQELTEYKKKLKTSQKKHEMGISSKNNYLAEKIAYIQFKELYDTTLNEYNTLLLEQKNATIKASQDGVLTNLIAENSYINYGTKIATLIDNDNFVKLFIESSYVNKIKRGMVVHLQSNYQNSDAIIINILPQSSNNLIEAIAKPNKKLPLDLHLTAQIELKQLHGLFIPKEAIVLVNNHPAIYLIDDKNIAHIFFIDIQKDMIDNALITNTLPENAKIALKNAYMLHDNLRVEVRNDAK